MVFKSTGRMISAAYAVLAVLFFASCSESGEKKAPRERGPAPAQQIDAAAQNAQADAPAIDVEIQPDPANQPEPENEEAQEDPAQQAQVDEEQEVPAAENEAEQTPAPGVVQDEQEPAPEEEEQAVVPPAPQGLSLVADATITQEEVNVEGLYSYSIADLEAAGQLSTSGTTNRFLGFGPNRYLTWIQPLNQENLGPITNRADGDGCATVQINIAQAGQYYLHLKGRSEAPLQSSLNIIVNNNANLAYETQVPIQDEPVYFRANGNNQLNNFLAPFDLPQGFVSIDLCRRETTRIYGIALSLDSEYNGEPAVQNIEKAELNFSGPSFATCDVEGARFKLALALNPDDASYEILEAKLYAEGAQGLVTQGPLEFTLNGETLTLPVNNTPFTINSQESYSFDNLVGSSFQQVYGKDSGNGQSDTFSVSLTCLELTTP